MWVGGGNPDKVLVQGYGHRYRGKPRSAALITMTGKASSHRLHLTISPRDVKRLRLTRLCSLCLRCRLQHDLSSDRLDQLRLRHLFVRKSHKPTDVEASDSHDSNDTADKSCGATCSFPFWFIVSPIDFKQQNTKNFSSTLIICPSLFVINYIPHRQDYLRGRHDRELLLLLACRCIVRRRDLKLLLLHEFT